MKKADEEDYCGSEIVVPGTQFVPRSVPWHSSEVIGHLDASIVALSPDVRDRLKPTLWNDLASEHDAENFCAHLERSGMGFSPEFAAFEKVWRRDEWNHYLGFRYIYHLMYGEAEDAIASRLSAEPINFGPLAEFLVDEFTICLLLAYDEIATTKSYSGDYGLYGTFGDPAFVKWIKWVTRDEAYHYHNAMQVIGLNHRHRIPEIGDTIERILQLDLSNKGDGGYQGTFVLDHTGEAFTPEFLSECARLIREYF